MPDDTTANKRYESRPVSELEGSGSMHDHFTEIAGTYSSVRTFDSEPVIFVAKKLGQSAIGAADIGCGDGRYGLRLAESSPAMTVHCVDVNEEMLGKLFRTVAKKNLTNVTAHRGSAEVLPFDDGSLDAVTTFNAVHHFDIPRFVGEAARVLDEGGRLFVYTRLGSQNRQNIWSRYFPLFEQKEDRLYDLEDLAEVLSGNPELRLDTIKFFRYHRTSTVDELTQKAACYHYSTFRLYTPDEFVRSLDRFRQNLHDNFEDNEQVSWSDENVMFMLRRD